MNKKLVMYYKCPNCGSDMVFDSESGKLSCPSCGRKDNIEDFPQEFINSHLSEDETKEYHCKNCGATLITDAETTATTCSFCGAGVVIGERLSGKMAPEKVIPFAIDKDQAMESFKSWCKKRRLAPKGFVKGDRIKAITGIYVPFWLYDLNSKVKVNAVCTQVRTYTEGDYIYTETKYYDVYRDINMDYIKVPVDASKKMNDELMDKLEPYNYNNLKDFKTPYLAGYIAEKYNFDDKELLERAKAKIEDYIESYIDSTVSNYSTVDYNNKYIDTRQKNAYYTLLPVWTICYDYNKSEYMFAINGQTGKIVGDPPISYGRVAAWFGGVATSTFIVLKLISFIMGGGF